MTVDHGDYATFTTRAAADEAAHALSRADRYGWKTRVLYSGAWDRWLVAAHRASRRDGNTALRTDGTVR